MKSRFIRVILLVCGVFLISEISAGPLEPPDWPPPYEHGNYIFDGINE